MAPSPATSSLATTISRNIKTARKHAGMTQRQFADLVGVEAMAVSRWERGAQRPKDQHLAILAAKLGLAPVWFYMEPDLDEAA